MIWYPLSEEYISETHNSECTFQRKVKLRKVNSQKIRLAKNEINERRK